MLPVVQQQAAGALARQIRRAAPQIARVATWQQQKSSGSISSAVAAISSPASDASVNPNARVLPDEEGHLPHVSVLLREVLNNLNHMPIKVRLRPLGHHSPQVTLSVSSMVTAHSSRKDCINHVLHAAQPALVPGQLDS